MSDPVTDPVASMLYDLMRDHLPVGTVWGLVKENKAAKLGEGAVFRNKSLGELAVKMANYLRDDEPDGNPGGPSPDW